MATRVSEPGVGRSWGRVRALEPRSETEVGGCPIQSSIVVGKALGDKASPCVTPGTRRKPLSGPWGRGQGPRQGLNKSKGVSQAVGGERVLHSRPLRGRQSQAPAALGPQGLGLQVGCAHTGSLARKRLCPSGQLFRPRPCGPGGQGPYVFRPHLFAICYEQIYLQFLKQDCEV